MIKSVITDVSNNKNVHVNTENKLNGLIVSTRPLKTFDNTLQFFTNSTYGKNLAQNGLSSGDNISIYDGGDSILWSPSTIIGNPIDFNFASTTIAHTGTQSIDCTECEGGDIFQLENNSIISPTFGSLTGWIYVTGNWNSPGDGCSIILYNTIEGGQVSENSVNLNNFIDGTNTNTWQKFTIPWTNFGIVNDFNAFRFTILNDGLDPNFYLDDIILEGESTTGPITFTITPPKDSWLHINTITFTYVDEYSPIETGSTFPSIPYNSFFNVPLLDTGLVYQRIQNDETIITSVLKRHLDIMTFGRSQIMGYGFDGIYSWISIEIKTTEPIILKEENKDLMQFIVSDDLSGLEEFQINISGKIENRD